MATNLEIIQIQLNEWVSVTHFDEVDQDGSKLDNANDAIIPGMKLTWSDRFLCKPRDKILVVGRSSGPRNSWTECSDNQVGNGTL